MRELNEIFQSFKFGYKFVYSSYFIIISILSAIIISKTDSISYIDGFVMSTGSLTDTGLSSVGMYQLSKSTIVLMTFLFMAGQTIVWLLYTLFYKSYCFRCVNNEIETARKLGNIPSFESLTKSEQDIITHQHDIYNSLIILTKVVFYYFIITLLGGFLLLLLALSLYPNQPELIERKYSRLIMR